MALRLWAFYPKISKNLSPKERGMLKYLKTCKPWKVFLNSFSDPEASVSLKKQSHGRQKLSKVFYLWEILRKHSWGKWGFNPSWFWVQGPCLQLRCRPREEHKNHKTVFNGWPSCQSTALQPRPWLASLQTERKVRGGGGAGSADIWPSWTPGPWLCCERHPRVDSRGQSAGSMPGPRHCKFNTGSDFVRGLPARPSLQTPPHAKTGRHGHCSS